MAAALAELANLMQNILDFLKNSGKKLGLCFLKCNQPELL